MSVHSDESDSVAAPYVQKADDLVNSNFTPTVKSFNNMNFVTSHAGRIFRILCEFQEPEERLRRHYVRSTILIFGSARSMTSAEYERTLKNHEDEIAAAKDPEAKAKAEKAIARLKKTQWMCGWMDKIYDLSKSLATFALEHKDFTDKCFKHLPDYFQLHESLAEERSELLERCNDLVITTGGGPGFMESANKGAADAGAKTVGMGVSLPFEKGVNPFVTKDLAFEFHYFFTRKFWMLYSCRAIVIAPGGFGTLDEMFEMLTLRQTKKVPDLPVVLLGKDFWKTVVNWQALADFGTVSQEEIDGLCFADTAEEALSFILSFFERNMKETCVETH